MDELFDYNTDFQRSKKRLNRFTEESLLLTNFDVFLLPLHGNISKYWLLGRVAFADMRHFKHIPVASM